MLKRICECQNLECCPPYELDTLTIDQCVGFGAFEYDRMDTKVAKKQAKEEAKVAKKVAKEQAKVAKKQAKLEAKEMVKAAKRLLKLKSKEEKESMPEDRYTESVLRQRYATFRAFYASGLEMKDTLGIRMTNMPEDISENITKFILRTHLDMESYWARHVKKPGDLWSPTEKIQENKCFMSDGPMSFGPDKTWDALYCLDLRKWMEDEIVLHRVTLTPADEAWQNIRMSGKRSKKKEGGEIWRDQCDTRGARPHIGWEALYPQIREHCTEVYRGTFEGIFSKGNSLEAISSTTGTETALPASA